MARGSRGKAGGGVPMGRDKIVGIAKPTIAEVLEEFLAEQRQRLAPKTFRQYRDIVELLHHCLNGYAYQSLGKAERKLFDRYFNAQGDAHREFSQIFGPDRILLEVGGFLDWFMIRKVIAGTETLRAAGTVTKRLAKWLAQKGYVTAEEAGQTVEEGAAAARDLPKCKELAQLLSRFTEGQPRGGEDDEIEDHFTVTRVEPGRIWLEPMLARAKVGPIEVPEAISRRCKVGWSVSGVAGRVRGRWRLVEAWNVYPSGA